MSTANTIFVIPQQYLTGTLTAPGPALINSIGNLGGFVAPTLIGQVQDRTGSVSGGLYVVAATCVVALAACALLRSTSRARTGEHATV